MVATLSPLVKNYADNLATLQWSSKARNLVTLVKMNDQAVVQDGMTQHAGELGNAAQIQRQNLDSLRDTLRYKQQEAERYEREALRIGSTLATERERLRKVERDRAALILQRLFRRLRHAKRLATLEKTREQARRALIGNDAELVRLEKQKEEALRKEAETKKRLAAAERQTVDALVKVGVIDSQRGALEERKAPIMAVYAEVRERMHADEICREYADTVKKEADATKGALEKVKKEVDDNAAKLKTMRDTIELVKKPDWPERLKEIELDLPSLRARHSDVKQKRDAAVAERDALRARHAKTFRK
ncbi:hypothetical protein STCU_09551 [Strigomonas culicis]|uniref:Kinesin motor domain-containing protein n=1 Tax=Strigomonas culicis TaxID=28005 RepID=S9TM15_9TRYP|nr:hypothetical protein STCU_09551 [Strigomonas culicis]|eukprot:EPY19262.1 hypothetical protein STCU_09551 [Strigomonas culicis]